MGDLRENEVEVLLSDDEFHAELDNYICGARPQDWSIAKSRLWQDRKARTARMRLDVTEGENFSQALEENPADVMQLEREDLLSLLQEALQYLGEGELRKKIEKTLQES